MIARFSLYGFLKNLRLFEAFLVLALRERGYDFLDIGILIAIQEITVNIMEIPSGAMADAMGRRRCMLVSMGAYITAYLLLGLAPDFWLLALGMVCFGTGDAFRTGTHKAMILTWLRSQGREHERTKTYGYTRSWSMAGSALSAILAGILVFASDSYNDVFLWSALPAALNFVNLASYPGYLDGEMAHRPKGLIRGSFHAFRDSMGEVLRNASMRRLLRDTMSFEGGFDVVKHYLQPLLQHAALGLPILLAISLKQRTALLCGVAYAGLFLLNMWASRRAHRVEARWGGTEPSVLRLFRLLAMGYLALAAALALGLAWVAVVLFVAMWVMQNLWRPIHVGRFDREGDERFQATTLSIESQAKSLAGIILAPLIGALIDLVSASASPVPASKLWPVAIAGIPVLLVAALAAGRHDAGPAGNRP